MPILLYPCFTWEAHTVYGWKDVTPKQIFDDLMGLFGKKDEIDIILDKQTFSSGDTITGKVVLHLNKPKKAKALNVYLFAIDTSNGMYIGNPVINPTMNEGLGGPGIGYNQSQMKIYNFKLTLDGEKEYGTEQKEYLFELKIPMANSGSSQQGGFAGNTEKALSMLSGMNSAVISWYLKADLEEHLGIGVSKKIQLSVG